MFQSIYHIDKFFKYGTFDLQKLKFVGDNEETLFETQTKFDLANVNIDYQIEKQKFSLDSVQDLKDKGYSGDIDFGFMYRGSFENFITGIQIKSDEVKLSGFPVKNVDIDLQANEKTLNIGQFYLEYEENPLLVNGYVQFAPVKYNVSMLAKDFNLNFLGVNKDVEQASGIANIDAIFSNESTTGHILLDNFNYKTKDHQTLVDSINANIDLRNNKLVVNRLDGGYNGGTFKVSGDLDVPKIPADFMKTKRLELGKFELNAALDKVGLHYGKGIDFALTGNLIFTENRLFGDLVVSDAEVREIPNFNSKSETENLSEEAKAKKAQDKTVVEGIVEALENNADIIITGRCADPALFLAPLIYEFNWNKDDADLIAKGIMIGHLLECGAQVSGGYYSVPTKDDVKDLWNVGFPIAEVSEKQHDKIEGRHYLVLLIVIACFVLLVYGSQNWKWKLQENAAMFLWMGVLSGFAYGFGPSKIAEEFTKGAKKLVYGALMIGMANGISLILADGKILDTTVQYLGGLLVVLPSHAQAAGMFLMQLLINGLITSGSGQAAATMPIMLPVADIIGMTKQTAVLAFNFGDGLSNYILPTSSALMGFIAMVGISYSNWMKFMWRLFLIWTVVGAVLVIVANSINYGPF